MVTMGKHFAGITVFVRMKFPIKFLRIFFQDKYTCLSSVWAFAVTLWEILGFACERPYYNMSNEKVIQNAEYMYYGGELQVIIITSSLFLFSVPKLNE